MRHYFLDTNVVMDYLAQRQPFWADAAELMQASVDGEAALYVASLSFSTIYYVLRKHAGSTAARAAIMNFEKLVTVVAVDGAIVRQAISGPFSDFEDGLQHYAAVSVVTVNGIVTRNPRDFLNSALPVLMPSQALTALCRP